VFNNILDYKPSYDNCDEIAAQLQKIEITVEKFENIHPKIVLMADMEEHNKYQHHFEKLD
jgi:cupin superfamily acireductone dioxygenase involved in methionine salvage